MSAEVETEEIYIRTQLWVGRLNKEIASVKMILTASNAKGLFTFLPKYIAAPREDVLRMLAAGPDLGPSSGLLMFKWVGKNPVREVLVTPVTAITETMRQIEAFLHMPIFRPKVSMRRIVFEALENLVTAVTLKPGERIFLIDDSFGELMASVHEITAQKQETDRKLRESFIDTFKEEFLHATEGKEIGMDYTFLRRKNYPSYFLAFREYQLNPGLMFIYYRDDPNDPRVKSFFSNSFKECTLLKPSGHLAERVVAHGTRGLNMMEMNGVITRVMCSGGQSSLGLDVVLQKAIGMYNPPMEYVVGVIQGNGDTAIFTKGSLSRNQFVHNEVGSILSLSASEKRGGIGKGWHKHSKDHSVAARGRK